MGQLRDLNVLHSDSGEVGDGILRVRRPPQTELDAGVKTRRHLDDEDVIVGGTHMNNSQSLR